MQHDIGVESGHFVLMRSIHQLRSALLQKTDVGTSSLLVWTSDFQPDSNHFPSVTRLPNKAFGTIFPSSLSQLVFMFLRTCDIRFIHTIDNFATLFRCGYFQMTDCIRKSRYSEASCISSHVSSSHSAIAVDLLVVFLKPFDAYSLCVRFGHRSYFVSVCILVYSKYHRNQWLGKWNRLGSSGVTLLRI